MDELRETSKDLAIAFQDFVYGELEVITDSDWFNELVEEKVKKLLEEKLNEKDNWSYTRFVLGIRQNEQ